MTLFDTVFARAIQANNKIRITYMSPMKRDFSWYLLPIFPKQETGTVNFLLGKAKNGY
jgi:hypothetical protein